MWVGHHPLWRGSKTGLASGPVEAQFLCLKGENPPALDMGSMSMKQKAISCKSTRYVADPSKTIADIHGSIFCRQYSGKPIHSIQIHPGFVCCIHYCENRNIFCFFLKKVKFWVAEITKVGKIVYVYSFSVFVQVFREIMYTSQAVCRRKAAIPYWICLHVAGDGQRYFRTGKKSFLPPK